jgi:2-dehydro-3-deoxyphosphogluconate aldolase/(4S)-4-hydroxy-2-oxoglutarate aldolase
MLSALARYKIIPSLNIKDLSEEAALKTCEALIKGGLPVMEIPFRRHTDSLALKAIVRAFPDFLIGASGIFNSEQLLRAVECRIKFASAPGVCPDTLNTAAKQKTAFMPGVITPTEIQMVLSNGFADFQFFPAHAAGGVHYLETILKPFEHLPLDVFPKGSINLKEAVEYLKIPHVTSVVIGEILLGEYIAGEKWDKISDAARKALDYVNR